MKMLVSKTTGHFRAAMLNFSYLKVVLPRNPFGGDIFIGQVILKQTVKSVYILEQQLKSFMFTVCFLFVHQRISFSLYFLS